MKASFKINGKKWYFGEITLRMYYEVRDILAKGEEKEAEFDIVHSLTGCPPEELKKLKYQDWLLVWTEAQYHLTALATKTDSIKPIIEFKDKKYGLPAIEDLTIGEFADLDVILSSDNADDKMAEIAAILYRPIVSQKGETLILEPYEVASYRERVEQFRDFPLWAIRSANAFFLQSANLSLKNTAEFLQKEAQKKNLISPEGLEALQKSLQQDPGGDLSIHLQEKILSDLMQLPSSRFGWLSTGSHGKKTKLKTWLSKWKFRQNTK